MCIRRQITLSTLLGALFMAAICPTLRAQTVTAIEAAAGEPFGVGRIVCDFTQNSLPKPLGAEGIGISDKDGRILYPSIDNPAFGKLMKELLKEGTPLTSGGPIREEVGGLLRGILDKPPKTTIYFLFAGDQPLEATLLAGNETPLKIVPRSDPRAHQRLLNLWWKQYAAPPSLLAPEPDYPPLVDTYLTSMLARRLNLRLPEEKQMPLAYDALRKELGFNLGSEYVRMAMMQDRILGLNNLGQPADQSLPVIPPASDDVFPEPAPGVEIEPIALRVPACCFYVRFGDFNNFLWLQDTLARWGGDAQNLIALRGLDRDMSGRIERQLVLKQTVLSRMLGGTVIADVAIIGTDMFFREGACYGILFQARNNLALSASLNQQRSERLAQGGTKEEKITIDGHSASLLISPDGRVRSYYVCDGDFHFVTTSKTLAEMFLRTSSGDSLGTSKEFRHARSVMPLGRNDTIWLYLSDAFFRNATGPRYRVEMARRLQAASDVELVELARLAAAAEGRPGGSIEQLKTAGLLPPEFGPLPGGSRAAIEEGEVVDSLRGRRGAFLPVADVDVEKITQAELSEYARFAEFYRAKWGRLDPVIAAVKRNPLGGDREHVTVDVLMSPFDPQHFSVLKQWLGTADDQRLAPLPGDMAALELVLTEQRIFAGLRDVGPPARNGATSWIPMGRLRDFLVGYVGTSGELGLLSFLNIGIPPHSDPAGYTVSPLGGWRRIYGQFIVFSFQHDVLEIVAPQLRFEQAKRPAQVRLRVGDVSDSRITPTLNDLGYARTRETSLGNLRFLHALGQQLRVPPADRLAAAEFLLDAKMICPLGGKYVLQQNGTARWTSTALKDGPPGGFTMVKAPDGYRSPPLSWFRGLELEATMTEKAVSAHAEVIMQMPPK
ncbi:MAG: hypothetical protein JW959_04370 [Pirellulales bacterium]|nr:hypothetical protein [Pirellulales bacterium]